MVPTTAMFLFFTYSFLAKGECPEVGYGKVDVLQQKSRWNYILGTDWQVLAWSIREGIDQLMFPSLLHHRLRKAVDVCIVIVTGDIWTILLTRGSSLSSVI